MNKEVRRITTEIRSSKEHRIVEGYALLFNTESRDLGGFTEIISKEAITQDLIDKADVICWLNHNEDRGILARSKEGKGSLLLEIDQIGLKYSFETPNTALGEELLENLRRGDITESSFSFVVSTEKWEKRSSGKYLRRITGFKDIYDVSPVYKPAYEGTKVTCRSFEEIKNEESEELQEYFNELNKLI